MTTAAIPIPTPEQLGAMLLKPGLDKLALMDTFVAASKAAIKAKRHARKALRNLDPQADPALEAAGAAVAAAMEAKQARLNARAAYVQAMRVTVGDADLDFCEYALREAALVRDHRAALAEAEDDELVTGVQLQAAMA